MSALTSQNGFPVFDTTDHYVRFSAGGRDWWAASLDCAVVAAEYINQYAAKVEPVVGGKLDDWSANTDLRPIRGQTTGFSNHDSATAWDLNALRHPRGVHGTLTPAQVAAVHRILASITAADGTPVLRWGGDYIHAPIDAMHVEIHATAARVAQAAAKIRARHQPPKEHPMEPTDIQKIASAVWAADVVPYNKVDDRTRPENPADPLRSPVAMLEQIDRLVRKHDAALVALSAQIASLISAVRALPGSPSVAKADGVSASDGG